MDIIENFLKSDSFFIFLIAFLFILLVLFAYFYFHDGKKKRKINRKEYVDAEKEEEIKIIEEYDDHVFNEEEINVDNFSLNVNFKKFDDDIDDLEMPSLKSEEKIDAFSYKPDDNREINDNIKEEKHEYTEEKTEIFIISDFIENDDHEDN